MKQLMLTYLLSLLSLAFLAGQPDIDSLVKEFNTSSEDTTKLRLLSEISDYYRTREFDTAVYYIDRYILLAQELNEKSCMAQGHYFLGNALSSLGSVNTAALQYNTSLELYEELEDTSGMGRVYNSFGNMMNEEGNFHQALEYLTTSYELFRSIGEKATYPYVVQNIAYAYDGLGEVETARRYFLEAIGMLAEAGDTSRVLGSTYLNTGKNFESTGELEMAFGYYKQALTILKKLNNRPRIASAYLDIGNYFYLLEEYQIAKQYADSANTLAEDLNALETILDISLLYSRIYEKTGDFEASLRYAREYSRLQDQFRQQSINKQLEDFRIEREMNRIERANAIAIQKVKLTRNFAFLAFVLVFISLVFIYRSYRNKQKANAILAEMDELKSRMFSNISHELRTPLTLIIDPIEQMLVEERNKFPGKNTLKSMQRNSHKILGLVNQMLELSKLDAGKLKIDLAEGRVLHHLKLIASSFKSLAKKMDIHYATKFPEEELVTWFDIDKLDKILTNLLSNAFKYTPGGGSVSLNVTLKKGDMKKSGVQDVEHWLILSVNDTGKGIPEEDLPRIFDRFYQVGDRDDPEQLGTGIGLALTSELTELMKGEISAESQLGHGTRISLKLPLGINHLEEHEYSIVEEPVSDDMPSKTVEAVDRDLPEQEFREDQAIILVVDDSKDIRMHIRDNIRGFNILEAENGEEGLKLALDSIPDLVITDLRMPVMDGLSMCKKLKEDELTSHIPVIMLTAKSSIESRLEGLGTGADDYLTKPFNTKELGLRVQNLITQRQKLRDKYRQEFLLEPAAVQVESADEKFLNRTRVLIEEQLSNPDLNVEELGNAMAMSRMQLFRKIKSLTGQSPSEYIRTIRLKRAAQLIKSDYGNLAQITYEVGFNNPSYFAKCFRELYGVAPSEYGKTG